MRADESVLFIDERPNLFIDDSFNIALIESTLRESGQTNTVPNETKARLADPLARFEQALRLKHHEEVASGTVQDTFEDYLSDPLGICTQPSWYGAALRLKVACTGTGLSVPTSIQLLLQ